MRVVLLAIALLLISVSAVAFLMDTRRPGEAVSQRSLVIGQVSGKGMRDHPWSGATVELGPDRQVLTEDGQFRFVAIPGTYTLKVCCSLRFQAVNQQIVVGRSDVNLQLQLTPLTTIEGLLSVERGTEPPRGFKLSVALDDSNVVDRAMTNSEGAFEFHLSKGKWHLSFDNLPKGYNLGSMTLAGMPVRSRILEVSEDVEAPALPLRITLR